MIRRNIHLTLTILLIAASLSRPALSQPSSSSKATLDKIHSGLDKTPAEATLKQLEEIIAAEPKNYYARLVMGEALDRAGLPVEAIEQYKMAVTLGPDSPKAIIELVKAQIGLNQQEAAMRLLQEAHKRFPSDPEITFWVGNYYLNKGDLKSAEKFYLSVPQSKSNIVGMGAALGQVRLKQGRLNEALALSEKDLKDKPYYPLANAIKGLALMGMHNFRDAMVPLRNGFNEFGTKQDYAKQYTIACIANDDFRAALQPAMVAVAATTNQFNQDPETKGLLISLLQHIPSSFVRENVPEYTDKIAAIQKNAAAHFLFGDIFDAFGYHELAVLNFNKSLLLDPSEANTAFRLANDLELYFQKYDEAKVYLTKAHNLKPTDTEIADRLTRLEIKLPTRNADLAWQLKDFLRKQKSPI